MIAIVDNVDRLLLVLLNDLNFIMIIFNRRWPIFSPVVNRRLGFCVASLELARVGGAGPVVHHRLLAEVTERLLRAIGGVLLVLLVMKRDFVDRWLVDVGVHAGLARLLVLEIVAGYALFIRLNVLYVLRAKKVSVRFPLFLLLVMVLKVLRRAHLVGSVLVLSGGFGDFGRLQVLGGRRGPRAVSSLPSGIAGVSEVGSGVRQ